MLPSRILYYAKMLQTSGMKVAFIFPSAATSYAKMLQTSGMKAAFIFPSAATSYAKMLQTSGMKVAFIFPSAATSYANVRKKTYNQTKFVSILSRTGYLTSSIFRAGVRHIGCRFYRRYSGLHQEKAENKMPTAVRKMDEEHVIMLKNCCGGVMTYSESSLSAITPCALPAQEPRLPPQCGRTVRYARASMCTWRRQTVLPRNSPHRARGTTDNRRNRCRRSPWHPLSHAARTPVSRGNSHRHISANPRFPASPQPPSRPTPPGAGQRPGRR